MFVIVFGTIRFTTIVLDKTSLVLKLLADLNSSSNPHGIPGVRLFHNSSGIIRGFNVFPTSIIELVKLYVDAYEFGLIALLGDHCLPGMNPVIARAKANPGCYSFHKSFHRDWVYDRDNSGAVYQKPFLIATWLTAAHYIVFPTIVSLTESSTRKNRRPHARVCPTLVND